MPITSAVTAFTYTISDDGTSDPGHTDTATVNVTINNVNDAPDAVDDSATVDEDTSNNAINVLANDTDADNLTPPANAGLTVIAVTQGTHGSVTFTPTGVSYTPAPNYFGSDSFTYTISDNGTATPATPTPLRSMSLSTTSTMRLTRSTTVRRWMRTRRTTPSTCSLTTLMLTI